MGVLLTRSEQPDHPISGDGVGAEAPRYAAWDGVRKSMSPESIVDVVAAAGLVGKGGAGFPTHKKMRLMRVQPGPTKYLVLNGSEHEPGSMKDRYLLEHYPHTVLEGALILAFAVGASNVIVAVNVASPACILQLKVALLAAADAGIDFGGILIEIFAVPDTYIVGEETALLEVIEGHQALPRKKPPFPIEAGVHGLPTLVQNIETAAHLPLIISGGASAYRAHGVNGKGVTLCTLGPEFNRPGVHEVPLGMPVREVLGRVGGGLRNGLAIKAIQPGGPSSGFLVAPDFDLPLDADELKQHGAALGCAAIKAYSIADCMVAAISEIMHFFAHGSCGQCPRCRMETNMLDTIVRRVLTGGGNWQLLGQVDKLIELSKGEGKCTLIDMPVAPIRTGLTLFRDEFQSHIEGSCTLHADSQAVASSTH
jgi:NADH:ubiquinone oxidoreductase subunit F (NADH-binding)